MNFEITLDGLMKELTKRVSAPTRGPVERLNSRLEGSEAGEQQRLLEWMKGLVSLY